MRAEPQGKGRGRRPCTSMCLCVALLCRVVRGDSGGCCPCSCILIIPGPGGTLMGEVQEGEQFPGVPRVLEKGVGGKRTPTGLGSWGKDVGDSRGVSGVGRNAWLGQEWGAQGGGRERPRWRGRTWCERTQGCRFLLDRTLLYGFSGFVIPLGGQFSVCPCSMLSLIVCLCRRERAYGCV